MPKQNKPSKNISAIKTSESVDNDGYVINLWNKSKIIIRNRKQASFRILNSQASGARLPSFRICYGNTQCANFIYRHLSVDLFYKFTITLELEFWIYHLDGIKK